MFKNNKKLGVLKEREYLLICFLDDIQKNKINK